jgi:Tfp pilus assembly protein PilV
MKNLQSKQKIQGFGLTEVIIGAAILILVFLGLITTYNRYVKAGSKIIPEITATYLLEEGLEAVRFMRDYSWDNKIATLAAGTTYYLAWDGSLWNATTTATSTSGMYYRTFTIASVSRDSNQDIASVGGTDDPQTKKVTMQVAWKVSSATSTKQFSMYIADLFNN